MKMKKIFKSFQAKRAEKKKMREIAYSQWQADIEKNMGDYHNFISRSVLEAYIQNYYIYFNVEFKNKVVEDQDCNDKYIFTNVTVVDSISTKNGTQIDLSKFSTNDLKINYLKSFID